MSHSPPQADGSDDALVHRHGAGFLRGESSGLIFVLGLLGIFLGQLLSTAAHAVVARYSFGAPMAVFGTIDNLGRSLNLLSGLMGAMGTPLVCFGVARMVAKAGARMVRCSAK